MKDLTVGPFQGLALLHGPGNNTWLCIFCADSNPFRGREKPLKSNLYKHMNRLHGLRKSNVEPLQQAAHDLAVQLRVALQGRDVQCAEEVWDKFRKDPVLKPHCVPTKTADKRAWVERARQRLISLASAGVPVLRQQHDDSDAHADIDRTPTPAPAPMRGRAPRGRQSKRDPDTIDLTSDPEPEERPRARDPRSASPPRRRPAPLLPAGRQAPVAEPIDMREFCEAYRVAPRVRDVLVAAGWTHSDTLRFLGLRELAQLDLNDGEVAQLRSAVERWAAPVPGGAANGPR